MQPPTITSYYYKPSTGVKRKGESNLAREIKPLTIEDANIAAFLAMKGFNVKPFVKNKESQDVPIVAWMVHGDRGELEAAIEKYYANEEVGISDFVGQLKQIRGAMYNLKKTNSYQHLPSSEDGQH